jgi:hypothetical protein
MSLSTKVKRFIGTGRHVDFEEVVVSSTEKKCRGEEGPVLENQMDPVFNDTTTYERSVYKQVPETHGWSHGG